MIRIEKEREVLFDSPPLSCAFGSPAGALAHVCSLKLLLTDVLDGLVHPLTLIIVAGLEDAATVDVAEELVSGPIHGLLFTQFTTSVYRLGCTPQRASRIEQSFSLIS